ncbi:hypothetical protein NQ317_000198 [Molorchus minor]|uniref:Uncharacterized protein n=1 Tax=Molorchus minor TaxID=1323400 RepID=A0ABQ9JE28_9CUCU|nr:hypothetical protein NQ317_000198 [Molorchus minor]
MAILSHPQRCTPSSVLGFWFLVPCYWHIEHTVDTHLPHRLDSSTNRIFQKYAHHSHEIQWVEHYFVNMEPLANII